MSTGSGAPPLRGAARRDSLQHDPRWAAVQGVVASPTFTKSTRLTAFLLYICERSLLGAPEEVSEQQIGVHVFERAPEYNANEDNIVRVQARLLRRKLDEYYAAEGRQDAIRIQIPKGAYLPVFEAMPAPAAEPPPAPPRRLWLWIGAAAAVVAIVAAAAFYWTSGPASERHQQQLVKDFWGRLFNSAQPTVIVPCDTAFVLYQGFTGREIGLERYINGEFWKEVDMVPPALRNYVSGLAYDPYTNNVDLGFCWRLARRPGLGLSRTQVRPARNLVMADLKGSNAVLIGARRANPWVSLFDQKNTFQGLFEDNDLRNHIRNRDPRGGERRIYVERHENGVAYSYSLLLFLPGLSGNEHTVILSGLTSPGTEAAADFLLNDQAFGRFLATITPAGGSVPHFEAVLEVERVSITAPRAAVIAYRVRKD